MLSININCAYAGILKYKMDESAFNPKKLDSKIENQKQSHTQPTISGYFEIF